MNVPPALLTAFPASAEGLLDLARRQVDDGMLAEIARADYGQDAETHLAALVPIRDHGQVPVPMDWHPGEVLGLIRWSQPEDPKWEPGSTGTRGHQMRAFACAALLRAAAEPGNEEYDYADGSSLAQCLASAKVLGEEMLEAAARFLTWRIPSMADGQLDRPLFSFGLLMLAAQLQAGRFEEHILGEAAEWVLAEEAALRQASGPFPDPEGWHPAFGYTFSMQQGFWHAHATQLIRQAATIHAGDVRNMLEFVGTLVLDPC